MSGLPNIHRDTALFLDFDGTLADLAPRPEAVQVVDGVIPLLARLYEALDGALAIISGRSLADIDRMLSPLQLPAAGEHGAQRRHAGRRTDLPRPDLGHVMEVARSLAAHHGGLWIEEKQTGIALHYRMAPNLHDTCFQILSETVAQIPGLTLLAGKCVLEVKPSGVDKGEAIAAFMAESPFLGKRPVFAGDDVTDEAGFATVQRLRGQGLKVGQGPTQARYRCASPQALRDWLWQAHLPGKTS